jgi:hypothetical protein
MVIVSPGVYSREVDLSLYTPQLATAILGLIGTASKGPVNEVTLITDEGQLVDTFGPPSGQHYALFAAVRFLRKGNQLKFVRVADYDIEATGTIKDQTLADAFSVLAVSSGSWGNNISLLVGSGTDAGTYKITVLYNGMSADVYDLLKVGPLNVDDVNYIMTRINGISEYISVTALASSTTLDSGTVTLSGGDDGAPAQVSDYIGSVGDPPTIPATGLQLFANPETEDVNVIAVPGISHRSVISAMQTLCESRADCIYITAPPYGKTVKQAVAWMNGLGGGPEDPLTSINSSYGAVFYPWIKVYDGYSDSEVWIPPDGHVAGAIAFTDFVADPWWAILGLNRGLLSDALNVEYSATQGERDYMYSNGNSLNPIINMAGQGIVIWGQRTAQRQPTALDRINVRRLLLYMRKAIATATLSLVGEPNDEDTWSRFRLLVSPIMEEIRGRRGITDYQVVCDETTNTAARRNRNEMYAKVMFKPTKTAEMIQLDFVILNQQTSFSEL